MFNLSNFLGSLQIYFETASFFIYIHKEKQISIKKNQGKAILVRTNFSLI